MAAAMRSRNGFDAKMISFRKGSWSSSSGKDGAGMDGAELIALVDQLMLGWTKWVDRRPADYRLGFVRDCYRPPMRGDLGDSDSAKWERRNREAVDPWEFGFYLPLFDAAAGQTYIYTTSTQGGRDCLADLQEAYADHTEAGKQPLVKLSGDRYDHRTYGEVETPKLAIVRWVDAPEIAIKPPAAAALTINRGVAGTLIEHQAVKPAPVIDDDIPF
jgi:hypothetical protein